MHLTLTSENKEEFFAIHRAVVNLMAKRMTQATYDIVYCRALEEGLDAGLATEKANEWLKSQDA